MKKILKKAAEYFTITLYKDGLERLGDYYMYEKSLPLLAFSYYKKAGNQAKIDDISKRMVNALAEWLGRDKLKPEFVKGHTFTSNYTKKIVNLNSDGMIPIQVDNNLRNKAKSILETNTKNMNDKTNNSLKNNKS